MRRSALTACHTVLMKKHAWLTLALPLLLTACPRPPTVVEPQPLTVSGTVVEQVSGADPFTLNTGPWKGGAGQVVARSEGDAPAEIARGTLNADGSFSLTLPREVDSAFLSSPTDSTTGGIDAVGDADCSSSSGQMTISDPAVLSLTVGLTAKGASKSGLVFNETRNLQIDEAAQKSRAQLNAGRLVYVDRTVTVSGTVTCTTSFSDLPVTLTLQGNFTLNKGWNKVSSSSDIQVDVSKMLAQWTVTTSVGALPTNQWVYQPGEVAMPLSLFSPLSPRLLQQMR